ncbi:MAG: hypothetical protein ABIC19_03345 [Patescibacteria group bacterium]|nr:hypothetical protein [Patescibacteria group bacterium]
MEQSSNEQSPNLSLDLLDRLVNLPQEQIEKIKNSFLPKIQKELGLLNPDEQRAICFIHSLSDLEIEKIKKLVSTNHGFMLGIHDVKEKFKFLSKTKNPRYNLPPASEQG